MSKILVLGGSGFVGSYLLTELINHKVELVATTTHDTSSFNLYHDKIEWVELHLGQHYKQQLTKLMDQHQPDILVNCLVVGNKTSEEQPGLANLINHQVNDYLVRQVDKHGSRKFYLVSTSNVFDNLPAAPDENIEPNADMVYGTTKQLGEKHVASLGSRGSIIRVTTVWGELLLPFQHSNLLADILAGKQMTIFTNIYRTPTAVPQVAKAMADYILGGNHVPILHLTENTLASFAYWVKLLPERLIKNLTFEVYRGHNITAVLGLATIYPEYSSNLNLQVYFDTLGLS